MMVSSDFDIVVDSLRKTTERGQSVLRLFNNPTWHDALESVFDSIGALRNKHCDGPRPSVVEDYHQLITAISQFDWLNEESEEDDRDQRLDQLKGIVGMIRIDVDRVVHLYHKAGEGPGYAEELLPSGTTMLQKLKHPRLFDAIERRLERIETALIRDIEIHQRLGTSASQHTLVNYFVRSMRCDVSMVKASLRIGENVDLGILERASVSMLDVTGRMFATVISKFSEATSELRTAVVRIREPVRRFAKGVHTFLKYVVHTRPSPVPDDSLENDKQVETGPSGGELLRVARERLDLSFEDVARVSRVGIKFLAALEKGDFSVFSAEHYIIGFGKSYARAVGESEEMIATLLRRDLKEAEFEPRRMKEVWWASEPADPRYYRGPLKLDVDTKPKQIPPRGSPKKKEDPA